MTPKNVYKIWRFEDLERKSYKKMTRTMRMGEDIIATKFGSWKIEEKEQLTWYTQEN